MSAPEPKPPHPWAWARNPKAGGAAAIAALLLSVMLVGLELALGRLGRGLEFENLPGFYALAGLAGALLIFAIGLGLRALLARGGDETGADAMRGGDDDRQP